MNAHVAAQQVSDDGLDAEQSLLGAILVNNRAMEQIPSQMRPFHFGEPLHQIIFETAQALFEEGRLANPITVKSALPVELAAKKIGEITVSQYLARLAGEAGIVGHVRDLANVIMFASARREIGEIGSSALALAATVKSETALSDGIVDLIERMDAITADFVSAQRVSPGSAYLAALNAAMQSTATAGVPIAFREIQSVLSEPTFEAGNLYGLLSSSGEGKTSITLEIIYHAILKGHPVLFLSYDQSPVQCVQQMIQQQHGITMRRQKNPNEKMSGKDVDKVSDFAIWLDQQPFEIIRCRQEGVGQLVAYAKRFAKKRKSDKPALIVIDHIAKVKPRDPKLSPDRISGEVNQPLKSLADEIGCAVLMLQQRNTYGTKRDNPRPIAADLYGGEGAKQDYDAILYLYRPEKYKAERMKIASTDKEIAQINRIFGNDCEGLAEIGSIKCRFGDPNITETLRFDAQFTRYRSIPKPELPKEFEF